MIYFSRISKKSGWSSEKDLNECCTVVSGGRNSNVMIFCQYQKSFSIVKDQDSPTRYWELYYCSKGSLVCCIEDLWLQLRCSATYIDLPTFYNAEWFFVQTKDQSIINKMARPWCRLVNRPLTVTSTMGYNFLYVLHFTSSGNPKPQISNRSYKLLIETNFKQNI